MTDHAECDEIVQNVVTESASFNQMMHLQVFQRTAILTPPPIPFENSSVKQFVFLAA
jgi:hypothetical protein